MLKIRFQRTGRTNDAAFRIVVLESERAAKAGAIVEQLGTYNPHSKAVTLATDRVKHWLSVGAQATGSIHNLLINQKVIEGEKVNVLPKKTVPVKETPVEAAAPTPAASAVETAPAPVAEVEAPVEAPTEAEVAAEAEPAPVDVPAEASAPTPEVGEPTANVGSEEPTA